MRSGQVVKKIAPEPAPLLDGYARKWSWLEWIVPAILCALMFGQLFFSDGRLSQNCDESTHLYAGYRYWKCADFSYGSEHPPLAKLVAALPLLASGAPIDCAAGGNEADEALHWLYAMPDWESALARARAAVSIFALGLCVLVWIATRSMFGFTTAALATAVLAFDPNILASGGVVMTDMAVTFAFAFAAFSYYLCFKDRSLPYLALAGVATGIVLVAKNSGVLILPVLVLLALADPFVHFDQKCRWRALRNLGGAGLIFLIAVAVLWIDYGLHFRAGALGDYWSSHGSSSGTIATLHDWHLLPEAYLGGLHMAFGLAAPQRAGGPYLFGHATAHAVWYFFPLVMLTKSTAAVLALLALSALGLHYLRREHRRELLYLLLPAGVFLFACMCAVNSMMRHVLPIYPLLFILIAAAVVEVARRCRWARYALPALLLLHAASSLHAYPFYFSYANEFFGGPSRIYKLLPATDMGEGVKEVKAYQASHHSGPCWLLTPFRMNPNFYESDCPPLMSFDNGLWAPRPGLPPTLRGTVYVSSDLRPDTASFPSIQGDVGDLFKAFTKRPPDNVIAGSAILVFEGDFDTKHLATVGESLEAVAMVKAGKFPEAVLHAKKAVEHAPTDWDSRATLCEVLVMNDSPPETRNECETARALLANDSRTRTPLYQAVQNIVWTLQAGGKPKF